MYRGIIDSQRNDGRGNGRGWAGGWSEWSRPRTGNFIRNRPSVKLCPIENRYFIRAVAADTRPTNGEDRQIFLWRTVDGAEPGQRENSAGPRTVSPTDGDYLRSASKS